jgi:hypothetical protein
MSKMQENNPVLSKRQYDLQPSTLPLAQSICATVPLAVLILWFMYEAYARPSQQCSQDVNNDEADSCSNLFALGDIIVVTLFVALAWAILCAYLSYFVPRRHALVDEYLTNGKTIIGDVFYSPRQAYHRCGRLTSYGTVVYPHPNRTMPVLLQRQVFVYEKFTREKSILIYLPDQPCSAQPKSDLRIDYDVAQLNTERLEFLRLFSIGWMLFSLACSLYSLFVLVDLESTLEYGMFWLPQNDSTYAIVAFATFVLVVIPVVSIGLNVVSWRIHRHWVTSKHKILQEGDPVNPSFCCYYEDDYEDEYSQTSTKSFRRMVDR